MKTDIIKLRIRERPGGAGGGGSEQKPVLSTLCALWICVCVCVCRDPWLNLAQRPGTLQAPLHCAFSVCFELDSRRTHFNNTICSVRIH